MNRFCRTLLAGLIALFVVAGPLSAAAQGADQNSQLKRFPVGYIGWNADPRYNEARTEQHFQDTPWGRPIAGARVALADAKFIGMAAGVKFALNEQLVSNTRQVFAAVEQMMQQGGHFILLDLPGGTIGHVAAHFAGRPVTFFNISSQDDRLRGRYCQPHLLQTIPSDAQRNDALAQYLVSRQWTDVLVLVGPRKADTVLADSFKRSADRFGVNIVDTRHFVLSDDPRQRQHNNIKLLTSGIDYDAVYIADTEGEFSRAANYATQHPRPVIGSAGLVPQAWAWSWRSYGARQLNHRIQAQAGRPATSYDWAAWVAVKAVVDTVQRAGGDNYHKMQAYLTGDKLALDSVKGYPMSFRRWDGQLRQPILLASPDWVIATAPLEGFENPSNYLDTLGFDARESVCKMAEHAK